MRGSRMGACGVVCMAAGCRQRALKQGDCHSACVLFTLAAGCLRPCLLAREMQERQSDAPQLLEDLNKLMRKPDVTPKIAYWRQHVSWEMANHLFNLHAALDGLHKATNSHRVRPSGLPT